MKAQSSVEFLVIFAVTLLGLLIFMGISQSESVGISQTKIRTEASNAVSDIGFAAADVYAQGAGAKKKITIMIPQSYEPGMSYVANQSIRLHSNGQDYVAALDFDVYGSLPQSSGNHEIWVSSEGSQVRVGNAMIRSSRETISAIMASNTSRDERFILTNVWNSSFTVSVAQIWSNPDVSLAIDSASFVLDRGDSRDIRATFTSGDDTTGFYSGLINVTADEGINSESISIPVTIEIAAYKSSDGPPLTIVPSSWSLFGVRGGNATETFQVCTNHETTLNAVDFSPSTGEPGSWVGMTEQLGTIEPSSCTPKTFMISIPADAAVSTHSGFIYLSGDAPESEDVLSFEVTVGGWSNDTFAPNITSLDIFPTGRIFEGKPVAVRAIIDDYGLGDNAISGCNASIDGGPAYQMISADGWFDEVVETAGYTFYSGYSAGSHAVSVDCADVMGNAVERNISFVVVKDFLFITQNNTPGAAEQVWMDWIDAGNSGEAFPWKMDIIDSSSFISGSANLSHYTAVVAAIWSSGMEGRLNSFAGSGGSLIMLGKAAADAPNALGLSSSVGNSYNDTNINMVDDTHYISSNYSGVISVANSTTTFGLFWKDVGGSLLGGSMLSSPPHWHTLAVVDNYYLWGPYDPDGLNEDGLVISTRVLDHAINSSAIG